MEQSNLYAAHSASKRPASSLVLCLWGLNIGQRWQPWAQGLKRVLCCEQMSNRRCLYIRAAAAAAAGHSGAQLAILGADAIGARAKVWWPLDENWCALRRLMPSSRACDVGGSLLVKHEPRLSTPKGTQYATSITLELCTSIVKAFQRGPV